MALQRNLVSRRFLSLLNPKTSHSFTFKFPHRPIVSFSVALNPHTEQTNKPPLSTLFLEAVGLSEKTATNGGEREQQAKGDGDGGDDPELMNNLRQLEEEVRSLKEKTKKPQRRSLYTAFTNKRVPDSISTTPPPRRKDEKSRRGQGKALSPEMMVLVELFYEKGYFQEANFAKRKERFDPSWFKGLYAWGYIKFGSRSFARDYQEIAKWLSGSALKQLAMFGCPSTDRSDVFPAKRLRKFFEVPENTVCSKCTLQQSCQFANQNVWKCETNNLDLAIVMKIITSYALDSVHPQLVVPDEVKKSVNQLLKEVVKLSQSVKPPEIASG